MIFDAVNWPVMMYLCEIVEKRNGLKKKRKNENDELLKVYIIEV